MEVADAGMVIVSAHGGPQIPDGVKNWLQLWLNRRLGGECALVELLDKQCNLSPLPTELCPYDGTAPDSFSGHMGGIWPNP
jgi:hypothetical protein